MAKSLKYNSAISNIDKELKALVDAATVKGITTVAQSSSEEARGDQSPVIYEGDVVYALGKKACGVYIANTAFPIA